MRGEAIAPNPACEAGLLGAEREFDLRRGRSWNRLEAPLGERVLHCTIEQLRRIGRDNRHGTDATVGRDGHARYHRPPRHAFIQRLARKLRLRPRDGSQRDRWQRFRRICARARNRTRSRNRGRFERGGLHWLGLCRRRGCDHHRNRRRRNHGLRLQRGLARRWGCRRIGCRANSGLGERRGQGLALNRRRHEPLGLLRHALFAHGRSRRNADRS